MYNIPKNYPIELTKLIHEYKEPIFVKADIKVDWQTIASYRNGQEHIDEHSEYVVKQMIGSEVAKKVDVWQDQNCKEGRKYYASIIAMKEYYFLDLLYRAYREGWSAAGDISNLEVKYE